MTLLHLYTAAYAILPGELGVFSEYVTTNNYNVITIDTTFRLVITIATTFRLLIHSTFLYHISSRKYYKHPISSTLGI